MPVIRLSADYRDFQRNNAELVTALQAVDSRVASVTSRMGEFNARGVEVGAVIKGLTKDGKEFVAVMGGTERQLARAAKEGRSFALSVQQVKFTEYVNGAKSAAAATAKMDEAWAKAARAAAAFTAAKKAAEAKAVADARTAAENDPSKVALAFNSALGQLARSAQYFVTYRAFGAITSEIETGIAAANKFQIQLSLIRTLSQQNQQTGGQFGEQVRRSSDKSGFSLAETGKAFYDAISNQVAKGSQVEAFTDKVAQLARVTGSNLTDAGNAVTASINAYGLSAADADRVSAVLFRTIDEGRVVMSELANTLGRVQVLAANVGVSMEEVSSVLAITTQKGFKTADAMTLLTNLLIKLEKPTEATKRFFTGLGVSSGEEAIRLYGFYGIMQKIVEEVRTGRTDVSAFFDEIRGRKQFAVFEQSIDQMARFSNELTNTAANIAHYNAAVAIRGESPADYLNNEVNKLKNVFAVDIGTKILDVTASVVKYVKSVGGEASPVTDKLAQSIKTATVVIAAYAIGTGLAALSTAALGTSMKGVALASVGMLKSFTQIGGPAIVYIAFLTAMYEISKKIAQNVATTRGRADGEVNPQDILNNVERLNLLRRREAERNAGDLGSEEKSGLTVTAEKATEAYRRLAGVIAQVNIANNRLLEDAKSKSIESAEAIKVAFASFADRLKESINEIRRGITESRNEIEKSRKASLGFGDSLNAIYRETQLRYANDFQKSELLKRQYEETKARAVALLSSNNADPAVNAENRVEGRRLLLEAARLANEEFTHEQDVLNRRAQQSGASGRTVDPTSLYQRLNDLRRIELGLEGQVQAAETRRGATLQQNLVTETQRLDRLQAAFKAYQELNPLGNDGKVKQEFQTNGQFDKAKFEAAQAAAIAVIRANAGGTADQRFQLEVDLFRHRANLTREAAAVERAEIIRTTQAKINADKEALDRRIQEETNARVRLQTQQQDAQKSLLSQLSDIRAFNNAIAEGAKPTVNVPGFGPQKVNVIPEGLRNQLTALDRATDAYERAVRQLETGADRVNGQLVYREADVTAVQRAYDLVKQKQDELNNRPGSPGVPTVNGQTMGAVNELTIRNLGSLTTAINSFYESFSRQQQIEIDILRLSSREGPLGQLRSAFPELAAEADRAMTNVAGSITNVGNRSVQPLIDKIRDLQKEFQQLQGGALGGPRAALDGEQTGDVFAAKGGQAGFFPGQPRGKDRYPIWAAKGEYIVNAQSSREFRPMLEAINNRRSPRYMAQGGVVGGDTNIGDINVTVNGGATNSDTGRAIAAKLAREIRRGTITRGR